VFTYQSNLRWIGRKFLFALNLMVSSILFGLPDWNIHTSNNNNYDAYNISASEATQGVGQTGGFRIYGTDVNDNFKVSIAFQESGAPSGGDVWCEIPQLTGQFGCLAVDGDAFGAHALVRTDGSGEPVHILATHERSTHRAIDPDAH